MNAPSSTEAAVRHRDRDAARALWRSTPAASQQVFGQHPRAQGRLRRPVFPVQPQRGLEPRGGHRQVRQLQHRPGRRRARGQRREDRLRVFRRHQPAGAELGRAGHARDRAPGRRRRARRSRRRERAVAICTCRTIRSRASTIRARSRCSRRIERYARALDPRITQVMARLGGRIRRGAGRARRRRDRRRRAPAGAPVGAGDRRAGRPPRAGQRRAAAGASTTPISPTRCCEDYARQGGATRRWSISTRARRRPAR